MIFIQVVPDQQFRIYHCVSGRCHFVPDVFQGAVSIRQSCSCCRPNEYLTGESWNFDYGHCWPDDDIEGFRTDATFVERVHRYAFTVLMKGHTTLWDAIEELRRSVREKYGVEHVHLQYGSEELQICEWMAVLTINIHLYAYSYPIRD